MKHNFNALPEHEWITSEKRFMEVCHKLPKGEAPSWSPFHDPAFFLAWWETYKNDSRKLHTLVLHANQQVVCALPMYIEHTRLKGLPSRVLRMIGDQFVGASTLGPMGESCQASFHSALPILANGRGYDVIRLHPLPLALKTATPMRLGAPFASLDLPTSTEDLWSSLSKSKRKELRRRRRFLENHGTLQLKEWDADAPEAFQHLVRLNSARFQDAGIHGGLKDPAFKDFFARLVNKLAPTKKARIFTLAVDGQVIAALSIFAAANKWYAYIGGHDPEWDQGSPAGVLDIALFEEAIQRGIRTYDFGPGCQEYKLRFGARPEQTIAIDVPRTLPWVWAYHLLRRA